MSDEKRVGLKMVLSPRQHKLPCVCSSFILFLRSIVFPALSQNIAKSLASTRGVRSYLKRKEAKGKIRYLCQMLKTKIGALENYQMQFHGVEIGGKIMCIVSHEFANIS